MAEQLRTAAATVEAGNAATITAREDLRAELAGIKASLQDFVGALLFYLHACAVKDAAAKAGILSSRRGRDGLSRRRRRPFEADRLSRLLRLRRCLSGDSWRQLRYLLLRVTSPRTDSRGRWTPSQISGGNRRLVSLSTSPPSMNSTAAGALAEAPRKSASTTSHARSSSMKSGSALLATGRLRQWLRWKRNDW
jgi:hypothetical protein